MSAFDVAMVLTGQTRRPSLDAWRRRSMGKRVTVESLNGDGGEERRKK